MQNESKSARRAVITGGTKGIGRAIAERMAEKGFDIALCSRSNDDLEETTEALLQINDSIDVLTLRTDVAQKEDLLAFSTHINESWPRVDILVNNAGVFLPGEILKEEDGVMERTMETNLYSAYHLTRMLMPMIRKSSSAHIVNMCSIASILAYPNGGSYSISKYALRGFSMVLREELKETGIKVTSVLPGATWSASWAGVDLPEPRLMQATDIAESVMSALSLSSAAVVEEIIIRPQLGDL